jgi:hypothetical protein
MSFLSPQRQQGSALAGAAASLNLPEVPLVNVNRLFAFFQSG